MKNACINSKLKISTNLILCFAYTLAIVDYVITYWGVHVLEVISEANPLMIRFMELPFKSGLFFRCILSFVPLFLLKCVENKFTNPNKFKLILGLILTLQVIPNALHVFWINTYLK